MTELHVDESFPAHTIYPDRVLYRVHRSVNDPIYFACNTEGRFNLTGAPGWGTCYMAPSPMGAYIEVFGRLGALTPEDIEERSLSEITLAEPLRLADLTDRHALGQFGVTGDLSTGVDYQITQDLASELYRVGFDGVYYTARHDPAFRERSIAVFGSPTSAKVFSTNTVEIPLGLVQEAARDYSLWVIPG